MNTSHRRFVRAALLILACASVCPGQAERPAASAPPVSWNVLIYAAIDNNAEVDGNFFNFLDDVRAACADDPGVRILLFADRSAGYSTNATSLGEDFVGARLYRVGAASCERLDGGAEFPELAGPDTPALDSADPQQVRKFLAWAKARYPARHTMFMLYGHADGRAMCPDEGNGTEMGFTALSEVVPAELSVDLMALELCYMGAVEIAYQWRPGTGGFSTKYLVSIPNAGPSLDWDRVFARLRSAPGEGHVDPATLTPEAFGALIVEEGGRGRMAMAEREPRHAGRLGLESVRCCDLSKVADLKRAVDDFAVALAVAAGSREVFEREVRGQGEENLVLNYSRGNLLVDPFADLHDVAVRAAACEALGETVREAAGAVVVATNDCVTASWGGAGLPRFVPGASGLAITVPLGAEGWKQCRWYTPDERPLIGARWAWCADGATRGDGVVQNWFELLDSWYDAPSPEPGVNGYAW